MRRAGLGWALLAVALGVALLAALWWYVGFLQFELAVSRTGAEPNWPGLIVVHGGTLVLMLCLGFGSRLALKRWKRARDLG